MKYLDIDCFNIICKEAKGQINATVLCSVNGTIKSSIRTPICRKTWGWIFHVMRRLEWEL